MINKLLCNSLFLVFFILLAVLIFPPFIEKVECKQYPAIITVSINRSIIKTIARDSLGQEQDEVIKELGKNNLHIDNFGYVHIDTSVLFSITTANYQFIGDTPPGEKKEIKLTFSCSKFTLYRMSMSEYDFQNSDIDEFNVSGNPIEFKILPGKDSYDFYFTFNITPEERVIPKIKEIKKEIRPKPKAKIVIKKDPVVYSYLSKITPVIDGKDSDKAWDSIPYTNINLSGSIDIKNMQVKSIRTINKIFILFKWQDTTNDYLHRLWKWNDKRKTYLENDSREDRILVKFSIGKKFSSCPEEGINSIADIWDWRAALTNPSGYADDKKEIMSLKRLPRSYKIRTKNNKEIYLQYLPDEGDAPYRQDISVVFAGKNIPQFLTQKPSGSRADVLSSGSWEKNHWIVEFERPVTTSDREDVQFKAGNKIDFLIAVYNHTELRRHNYSKKIKFKFK